LLLSDARLRPVPGPGISYRCDRGAARANEPSSGPAIFAEMIWRHFPNVPKLKMFARKPRDGWDVWGNEL
jgi:hypothetical protein